MNVAAADGEEGAGGVVGPGAGIEVVDAVDLGGHGQVGVAASDVLAIIKLGVFDGGVADELTIALKFLGDATNPARGVVAETTSG